MDERLRLPRMLLMLCNWIGRRKALLDDVRLHIIRALQLAAKRVKHRAPDPQMREVENVEMVSKLYLDSTNVYYHSRVQSFTRSRYHCDRSNKF